MNNRLKIEIEEFNLPAPLKETQKYIHKVSKLKKKALLEQKFEDELFISFENILSKTLICDKE